MKGFCRGAFPGLWLVTACYRALTVASGKG